jgi:hypothetical protein
MFDLYSATTWQPCLWFFGSFKLSQNLLTVSIFLLLQPPLLSVALDALKTTETNWVLAFESWGVIDSQCWVHVLPYVTAIKLKGRLRGVGFRQNGFRQNWLFVATGFWQNVLGGRMYSGRITLCSNRIQAEWIQRTRARAWRWKAGWKDAHLVTPIYIPLPPTHEKSRQQISVENSRLAMQRRP